MQMNNLFTQTKNIKILKILLDKFKMLKFFYLKDKKILIQQDKKMDQIYMIQIEKQ